MPAPAAVPNSSLVSRSPVLRGLVHHYSSFSYGRMKPVRRLVTPNTVATVSFGFGSPISTDSLVDPALSRTCLSRADLPATTAVTGRHCGQVRGITLVMNPLGAYRLFGVPMHEWDRSHLSPADLLPHQFRHLPEQLEAADGAAQARILNEALPRLLGRGPFVAPEIAWAWSELHRTRGRIRVKELAAGTHWSVRHLERRFREHVGRSPAAIAAILRLNHAMRLQDRGVPLAKVAQLAGYHDQAHYNHAFKAAIGLTPTQLSADRLDWTPRAA
ncbi:helix-turn-helix transcriptional regulator [Streptomyces sp. NBC_01264]|uniref:helix-turn-helix transcriptional regulator n=1 Tax=Streptomyces sp. NBC_01264 TaxID=2903804 RepID=UPI00225AFFA9|nr:helix-turn-helix transcriptional regulator [Streptomyces sp. NBC_01264]MCX4776454.1 helix-turn-helix transcriptional regulator [Streptomyces sp. NBC_01264]